jgi:hypothetical protein
MYAILYDKDNTVIAVRHGRSDVSTLNPGGDSVCRVYLSNLGSQTVDHYTLIPSGTPP